MDRHEADDRPIVVGIGITAPERDGRGSEKRLRAWAASRRHFALSTAVANRVISLARVLGRPVRNAAGTRIGRVSDIVVRWDAGGEYPPVTGVLIRVRSAFAVVQQADVTLTQTEVRLGSNAQMMWRPVWRDDEVALARDVLDRRLVDTSGGQLARAANVYLLNGPQGWELAGIDIGVWSCGRRLISRRRACSPPHGVVDWAQLHVFVPRFTYSTMPWESALTIDPGGVGDYIERCAVLSAVTSTPDRPRSMIEESAVPTLSSSSQPIPLMERGSS
jgi:sporulation protein YlmC with PRC-barrel domain